MVRCKFVCQSKTETRDYKSKTLYDYKFIAVTGSNPNSSDENKEFWKYTPSGHFDVNTVTDGQFEVGKEYYLDISPAE